jgi:hypothetical protein
MMGVVRDGRHPGGWTYGYRAIPGKPGEPEIVATQAEIVRRIFREYVAGETPRSIAAKLNAEMVPPPRGTYWRGSTIGGHTKRKTGILQNELYCGRVAGIELAHSATLTPARASGAPSQKPNGSMERFRSCASWMMKHSRRHSGAGLNDRCRVRAVACGPSAFYRDCFAAAFAAPACPRRTPIMDGRG